MHKLIKMLDGFIPPHMRNNPADLMRAYILVGVIFSNIFTGILTTVGLFALIHLPQETFLAVELAMLFLVVVYAAALYFLRSCTNHRLIGNLVLVAVWLLIVVAVLISGGYKESPIIQVFGLLPVMAFLFAGLKDGVRWLVISILSCVALLVLPVGRSGVMQLITSFNDRQAMLAILQTILMLVVGSALVVYEVINENLKNKLNQERDEFKLRASSDALTGIPNRFEFFRRLKQGMADCSAREQKLAVAYFDLNSFKPINDHYGHQAGDIVLQEVARRLQKTLRLTDTAARLGGDEFGLILPGIRVPEDLNTIMSKIDQAIAEPINIGKHLVTITGSTGVAIYPDHATEIDLLCGHADTLMYQNKLRLHRAADNAPSPIVGMQSPSFRQHPRPSDH